VAVVGFVSVFALNLAAFAIDSGLCSATGLFQVDAALLGTSIALHVLFFLRCWLHKALLVHASRVKNRKAETAKSYKLSDALSDPSTNG